MDKMEKMQPHARKKYRGSRFCALIKLFGPGSVPPEAKDVTFWLRVCSTEAYKHLLAPVFFEPKPITPFGLGFFLNRGIKVA